MTIKGCIISSRHYFLLYSQFDRVRKQTPVITLDGLNVNLHVTAKRQNNNKQIFKSGNYLFCVQNNYIIIIIIIKFII